MNSEGGNAAGQLCPICSRMRRLHAAADQKYTMITSAERPVGNAISRKPRFAINISVYSVRNTVDLDSAYHPGEADGGGVLATVADAA